MYGVCGCSVQVFDPTQGFFVTKTWKDVHVGDIIIVHKNHYIPADLLFLTAENEEGICYIETMQLDGETNLKIKKALDETKGMKEDTIGQFRGTVRCEPPNSRLYQFTGNLDLEPPLALSTTKLPLTPAAILLRGCSLRNTNRIFGMVIYAGQHGSIPCGNGSIPCANLCHFLVCQRQSGV
jgi:phospholipid-transporting ATPase